MRGKWFSDIDPCPDEEVLKQYAHGQIEDELVLSILTCHVELCPSCKAAVADLGKKNEENDKLLVKSIVKRLLERQSELERNQARGPIPGTIWRAVPDSDDRLFGPLLLVLSADQEIGEIRVAEVSEDLPLAGQSDLVLHAQESGLRFDCMVRGSNTYSVPLGTLKAFAGRLNDRLTGEIVEFCSKNASTVEVPCPIPCTVAGKTEGANAPHAGSPTTPDGSFGEDSPGAIPIGEVGLPYSSQLYTAGSEVKVRDAAVDDSRTNQPSPPERTMDLAFFGDLSRWITPVTQSALRIAAALALMFVALGTISAIAGIPLSETRGWIARFGGSLVALGMTHPLRIWLLGGHVPFPATVALFLLMTILSLLIAKKTLTNRQWLAIIPGGNLVLAIRIARVSYWWLPVLMLPALWLQALHALTFGSMLSTTMIIDKVILALLFPWLWPLVLILLMITGDVSIGSLIVNGFFLVLFLLGWFFLARGLTARRGKPFIWALLLFFPITTPIALLYLAFSD